MKYCRLASQPSNLVIGQEMTFRVLHHWLWMVTMILTGQEVITVVQLQMMALNLGGMWTWEPQ